MVEYSRRDPLMQDKVAATGVRVYRSGPIAPLRDRVLFGDLVSGELLHFSADALPEGGSSGIRRILLRDGEGRPRTFLQTIQATNARQGRPAASRADLRLGTGPDNRIFLLNKHDGVIRELTPDRG